MADNRPEHVDTVLFDLDDTLLDSYDARISALQAVFTQANVTDLTAEEFLFNLQGAPFAGALDSLAVEQRVSTSLFNDYRRIYWNNELGNVDLYPGIREMLGTLKSRSRKLGIVSNKFRDFEFEGNRIGCSLELEHLGVTAMFSAIIGLEDVSNSKPHPEGVRLAMDCLDSLPQHTLFVGDSAADITAAYQAGCWSCLATWGIRGDSIITEDIQPHFTVDFPGALLALDCLV